MKLKTRCGVPLCPKCGYPLLAMTKMLRSAACIWYSPDNENWGVDNGNEEEVEVVEIYCRTANCGFSLVGDAIHTVEVKEEIVL